MAHVHTEEQNPYYIDQLCTIGVCGALGGVAVMLWWQGLLWFLADTFHGWVLGGGIALLVLVLIRAVTLWFSTKPAHVHNHHHEDAHDHGHGDSCGPHHHHDHNHETDHDNDHHHDHDHEQPVANDHGHDHGWSPWRYAVLLLPVVLFLLDMPKQNQGFSQDFLGRRLGRQTHDASVVQMERRGGDVLVLGFQELSSWAQNGKAREQYNGYVGRLKGQFWRAGDDRSRAFTLVRFRMVCCATDAVPVNVLIVLANEKQDLSTFRDLEWVDVEGQIQFREAPGGKGGYLPVLQVASVDKIVRVEPDTSLFIQ